jgi:hypothetical protein
MSKQPFAIIHNLDGLDKDSVKKYLAEMSAYIGLDPELNGLDTIYMNDPQGGRALVPYARRGTCEILRNLYEVEVSSLTYATVSGSIVFTATGRSPKRGNRQEIAVGSKYVDGLRDKVLDNAIMTASTRALQRLTMQFTELGILAESEVVDLVGQTPNPAGSAQLAANPMPPAFLPLPAVPANNAPGKPVEVKSEEKAAPQPSLPSLDLSQLLPPLSKAAQTSAQPDIKPDIPAASASVTPVESTVTVGTEAAILPDKSAQKAARKPRKKPNTVVLDVEPETVSTQANPVSTEAEFKAHQDKIHADARAALEAKSAPVPAPQVVPAPVQANVAVPPQAYSVAQNPPIQGVSSQVAASAPVIEGLPSKEQMDEYRKKISVYTVQLPPSQDLGSTQKMRAFITRNTGTAPQHMTVEQWEEMIGWFETFVATNQIKGLVKYINDSLGVK